MQDKTPFQTTGFFLVVVVTCLCWILSSSTLVLGVSESAACETTNCGLRDFLTELKAERNKLVSTSSKLTKVITILSTLNNTSIYNTRVKQLTKLQNAIASLELEISVLDSKCSNTTGVDCDSCTNGYSNFPSCDIPTCYGILSTNKTSVCSGRGSCISPNTCNCTSPYFGSSCQNSTCTSFSNLIHQYQFINNNGQDGFGFDLTSYNAGSMSFSSIDVPSGSPKSITFSGSGGLYSPTNINFGPSQSLSFWMKKYNSNNGIAWSVGVGGPYIEFTNSQAFSVYSSGNSKLGTSDAIFSSNVWHHIVLVFKTSTVDIYANGALQKTLSGGAGSKNDRLVFGCYGGACTANYYWSGSMANILYFNTALTASDVQAVYKATSIC